MIIKSRPQIVSDEIFHIFMKIRIVNNLTTRLLYLYNDLAII